MTYYDKSMNYLNEFFELVPISANRLPDFHLKILTENAINSAIGEHYQLSPSKVEFEFYQIKKTANNILYFSEERSSFFSHPLINPEQLDEDILLVTLERTVGVIDCSSNRLFMELLLNQGTGLTYSENTNLTLAYEATKNVFKELYTLSHIPKNHDIHQIFTSQEDINELLR